MAGRDPHEDSRPATPLELLYDLTFVVAIGVAAHHLAEQLAHGHTGVALLGFVFSMWAILVGWINFSWFASAFDTDDWIYRLWTMVQMVGVVLVALGIVPVFHSLEEGHHLEMRLIVAGYVVMRVGLVAQWLRVARESERFRAVAHRNALWIVVAQVGWVAVALLELPLLPTFLLIVVLGIVELLVAPLAQGHAAGTPWHPHHIAERYGLLAIIALGEGVVGTVASSQSALGGATGDDWDLDSVLVLVAGIGLTFGMWWSYFLTPFGDLLHRRPRRGYVFGYGHIPLFMAVAAVGGGLHVAGLYLEAHAGHGGDHHVELGSQLTALTVVVPVALYLVVLQAIVTALFGTLDVLHLTYLGVGLALLAVAVVVAAGSMPVALLVATVATFIPVVDHETGGRHRAAAMMDFLLSGRSAGT